MSESLRYKQTRDVGASLEADVTDNLTYSRELGDAQLKLKPAKALTPPRIVVDFLDATVEIELTDAHVDMLADYTYHLQRTDENHDG